MIRFVGTTCMSSASRMALPDKGKKEEENN
jgi:hypothetical protein